MDVLGKPSRDNTCGFVTTTAYEKLKVENERLKTLVRHMHTCMDHVEGFGVYCDCDDCVFDGTHECDFEERIRELGIEVDDDHS